MEKEVGETQKFQSQHSQGSIPGEGRMLKYLLNCHYLGNQANAVNNLDNNPVNVTANIIDSK